MKDRTKAAAMVKQAWFWTIVLFFSSIPFLSAQTYENPQDNNGSNSDNIAPFQLNDEEKISSAGYVEPDLPVNGPDDHSLGALPSALALDGGFMTGLINARRTQRDNLSETPTDQLFWYPHPEGRYCRFTDLEGNTWFGLLDGQKFQWVLWAKNRYWWHDSFAGRWLTFSNGYWWFPGDSKTAKIEVYLNGDYHPFDTQGMVLADRDPVGELKSDYNGPFQGDFHGGQSGGRAHGGRGPRGQSRSGQSGWQGRGQWNTNPGAT
jgi:hypothetical protein